LTVPGAISGWMLALEAAKALGAKLPLDVLLSHAIRQAGEGAPVARSLAGLTAAVAGELKDVSGFAPVFLLDGKAPAVGHVLRQSALAATLDQLAHVGLADFYRGDVARELAADLDRAGSPVTRADLARHQATVAEPLSVTIDAGTLYNAPPPTQGLASLMILAMFDRLASRGGKLSMCTADRTARALARARPRIADPDRCQPRSHLPLWLDAAPASTAARPAVAGVWAGRFDGTADAGLVVSYIQSIYWEFGSGVVLPRTGVLMQNRGTAFSLDPRALNVLQPGRLPPHTLNPALAVLRDGRIMAYGTMGGDGQPQIQAALFTRHVLYRQPLEQAVDWPRWLLGRTWGSSHTNLRLEARFGDELVDRLLSAGHDVELLPEAYSDTMGHAGAVVLHPDGTLEGVHDPRADGGAAGV
jgi:gamma-glutamyltranspeptidase/glutathione hydrolase